MSKILDLYKRKETLLNDMLTYIKSEELTFTVDEREINNISRYVNNLNEHTKVIDALQAEINKYNKSEYETDKEVCDIEDRCKKIAKQIYDIDRESNDKMGILLGKIKKMYISAKNQGRYTNNYGGIPAVHSYSSFDVMQ